MRITPVLRMEMSSPESMFIGVTARSQVRQRVLPVGLQCLEIRNDVQLEVDNCSYQHSSSIVLYKIICVARTQNIGPGILVIDCQHHTRHDKGTDATDG
jgi:hypothetical protein